MKARLSTAWPEGGLWRHGDFLKLWSAETISQFGSQITLLALPLLAILILEASAFQVALLTTLDFLPFLLLSLPAGVWVDRLARRPIVIVTDIGRGLALLSIPLAYAADALTLAQLYAVGFVVGTMTVFFELAYTSYLPSLVERERLIEGNSKLEMSRSAAQIGGPGLGGALVDLLTAPVAVLLDAVSFFASALFVLRIKRRERSSPAAAGRAGVRKELAEGLRYVLRQRYLRPLLACMATTNLFWNLGFAIYLVYLVRELALSPALIGLVFMLGNIGWLVGAVLANRIVDSVGVGRTIVGSAFLVAPVWALVALAPQGSPIPFLVGAQALGSFGAVLFNITVLTLRQSVTPERMQGRTVGVIRTVIWGAIPLGSLIGGVLASSIGLRPTIWIAAIGVSAAVLPVLLSPVRSLVRMPEPEEMVIVPTPSPAVAGPSSPP